MHIRAILYEYNVLFDKLNLFDYNVQLTLIAFFHYPSTFLGQSVWKPTQNVQKKFYKER